MTFGRIDSARAHFSFFDHAFLPFLFSLLFHSWIRPASVDEGGMVMVMVICSALVRSHQSTSLVASASCVPRGGRRWCGCYRDYCNISQAR